MRAEDNKRGMCKNKVAKNTGHFRFFYIYKLALFVLRAGEPSFYDFSAGRLFLAETQKRKGKK